MREHLAGSPSTELVLCSSARRTVDTLEGIRAALPDAADVRTEDALYGASSSLLLERVRSIGDAVAGVLLIAHNPGVHGLAHSLVGDGRAESRSRLAAGFPTGAIATLSFDVSWADLDPGCAHLVDFFTPRRAG